MPLNTEQSQQINDNLLDWFKINKRELPWRNKYDPYQIWISEIMLQQTQVVTMLPYYKRWMAQLSTVEQLNNAPIEQLIKLWEGLGYYSRVKNIKKCASIIIDQHNGKLPDNYDALIKLTGIGPYTAGAILSIGYNKPYPAIDGNALRVFARVLGLTTAPRENPALLNIETAVKSLLKVSDANKKNRFLNQAIMELGATVCTPSKPDCSDCPINDDCIAYNTDQTFTIPLKLIRKSATKVEFFVMFLSDQNGNFIVRQRPDTGLWANFWELPVFDQSNKKAFIEALNTEYGLNIDQAQKLTTISHSFTRYRAKFNFYSALIDNADLAKSKLINKKLNDLSAPHKWLAMDKIDSLSFGSLYQKFFSQL